MAFCTEYSKAFFAVIKFYGTPLNVSSLTLIKCRIFPPPTDKKSTNSDSFVCRFLISHSYNFHNNCRKVQCGFHFPDFHKIHKPKLIFSQQIFCEFFFFQIDEKETVDKILFLLLLKEVFHCT